MTETLTKNSNISESQIENARYKILHYLSKSERTEYDCEILLKRKKIPDEIIKTVIEEAKNKNWLSDERFARLYTEDAIICGRSPLDIKHKLKLKRITTQIIEKVLNELYSNDATKRILEDIIDTLIHRNSDTPKHKLYEKIATTLYRKGFMFSDYDDILRNKIKETDFKRK